MRDTPLALRRLRARTEAMLCDLQLGGQELLLTTARKFVMQYESAHIGGGMRLAAPSDGVGQCSARRGVHRKQRPPDGQIAHGDTAAGGGPR